jgi:hypothetical protein
MADVTDTFYSGEAFIGYKGQFKVGLDDGSPETFVAAADITMITPGPMTTGTQKKTHLRSPGRAHEYLATIRDLGPFAMTGNYRPGHGTHKQAGGDGFDADHSLVSLWRNVTENNFLISVVDADANTIELPFRGVITKYQIGGIELEKAVDFTMEVQPLSDWTGELP